MLRIRAALGPKAFTITSTLSRSHWQHLSFWGDPLNYDGASLPKLMHWRKSRAHKEFLPETVPYETSVLLCWVIDTWHLSVTSAGAVGFWIKRTRIKCLAVISPLLCFRKDRTWKRKAKQVFLNFLKSLENVHSSYKKWGANNVYTSYLDPIDLHSPNLHSNFPELAHDTFLCGIQHSTTSKTSLSLGTS